MYNIHSKNVQEPEQVGYLYNLLSFKGCNSNGPDCYRVQGGTQAIHSIGHCQPCTDSGSILLTLGDPVTHIRRDDSHSFQVVTAQSGKVFGTKTIVVTGSPPVIQKLHFDPPWPGTQAQLLQRMPMGTTCKCIAIYKTNGPWWRTMGLTGGYSSFRFASLPLSE